MTCRPTSGYIAFCLALTACGGGDEGATEPVRDTILGLDARPSNRDCLGSAEFPDQLSKHPCFVDDPPVVSEALVPYDVISPLWSDAADKQRYLAVPDGESFEAQRDGSFELPKGGVLVKEFSIEERRLETRLLVRDDDGDWHAATYVWNEEQSDATREEYGEQVELQDGTWQVPTGEQCFECHTEAAGISLGLSHRQMARELEYPSTGRVADQLQTLAGVGLLLGDADDEPLVSPEDPDAALEQRARSYLHANCAHCHRPGGLGEGEIDLRVTTPFRLTKTCNEEVLRGDPIAEVDPDFASVGEGKGDDGYDETDGLDLDETDELDRDETNDQSDADEWNDGDTEANGERNEPGLILVPGEPAQSALYARITSDDGNWRMPPVGTRRVDPLGSQLIHDWIESLEGCPE